MCFQGGGSGILLCLARSLLSLCLFEGMRCGFQESEVRAVCSGCVRLFSWRVLRVCVCVPVLCLFCPWKDAGIWHRGFLYGDLGGGAGQGGPCACRFLFLLNVQYQFKMLLVLKSGGRRT